MAKLTPEQRGLLVHELLVGYARDAEFRPALQRLGDLADLVPSMPLEFWRVDQLANIYGDVPAARYRDELNEVGCSYGLDRLPSIDGNPSGLDILHAWCERRRTRLPLKPEQFALAADWGGPVPLVRFGSPDDASEPAGEPPRIIVEWSIGDEPRGAVLKRIRGQMDAVEAWWATRGYAIGRGRTRLQRDAGGLAAWMMHDRKPNSPAARRGARRLAQLLGVDLRS